MNKELIIKYSREEGLIIRIAMVLERRSYTLNALTNFRERNEMKISVSGSEKNYDQIVKQLSKLVDVIEVSEKERVRMYTMTGAPAAMA